MPETQLAHIRLTPADQAHIAAIREREEFIRDTDAIRHALKFTAELGQKKAKKNSSRGA